MKKINMIVGLLLAAAVVMAGCGKSADNGAAASKAADASASAIGNDLLSKISYEDDMSELDLDMAMMMMDLSDVDIKDSFICESTGATAEEIVVLECGSTDAAKKASEAFKKRVAEQKESYEDYVPEELKKLDVAVIATSGNFAVLSVSGDADTAKSVIMEYLQ